MSKPTLSVAFSTDNLLQNIANIDGYPALIGTALNAANQGKIIIVNSRKEAEQAGITSGAEPAAWRQIKEFYTELGGNMPLYLLFFAPAVTMAEMLDSTASDKATKLMDVAAGLISCLGVFRAPLPGYNAGADFIDTDVPAAVTAAKTFVQAQNDKLRFLRVLIEGRVATEGSATIYAPNTASNGFAGVVLGGTKNDLSASVGLALGRKMKYAAHIKLGKVANGPLSANEIYIGTKKLNEHDSIVVAAVAAVAATATLTVTAVGATNDTLYVYVNVGSTTHFLAYYTQIAEDDTVTKVATAIKNLINGGTGSHGFTATSAAGVVTVTAPIAQGASLNTVLPYVGKYPNSSTFAVAAAAFTGGVTARAEQTYQTDIFHDKGYISFLSYPGKAGFYFGIDNMATDADDRILVHGAVLDAAAKVVADVYINELEGEVDTNPDGTIKEEDAKHLEDRAKQQVEVSLGERISAVEVLVDRTVNIINTSTTKIKVRVRPKGYNTFIEVDLGLTAG